MKNIRVFMGVCALIVLFIACGGKGELSTEKNRMPETDVVVSEPPALLQEAGKSFTYSFDSGKAGQLPAKFHTALTGGGPKVEWVVKEDPTAPSKPNIIAQVSNDKTDYRFPLLISDEGSYK